MGSLSTETMKLGYNTNGFAHHRLEDALAILADLGYESVAITLDFHHLDPFDCQLAAKVKQVRQWLGRYRLSCVVETGARFLLDPRRKHRPTLLSRDPASRQRRLDFLERSIAIARDLGTDIVSLWSGTAEPGEPSELLWDRLADACRRLSERAEIDNVRLAFEPEPGMFIDTLDRFDRLRKRVASQHLGLTVDIGHLHCTGEVPIADQLRRWRDWLWNVHIEDMKAGVHEHLMFGEGEIDFGPVLETLVEVGYSGGVHVELSRHSHDAVETARRARDFLRRHWPSPGDA